MANFIDVQHLEKVYQSGLLFRKQPKKRVLSDINLTIVPGQSIALVGASGSGKSTLCRMILGLEPATSGDVLWNGRPLSGFSQQDWRDYRQDVQLVFQDAISAVNPRQTIAQILAEPLRYLRTLDNESIVRESAPTDSTSWAAE